MNAAFSAILTAAALTAAGATGLVVLVPSDSPLAHVLPGSHAGHDHGAGADEHKLHGGMSGDHAHEQTGMARPAFPAAAGSVPSAEAAKALEEVTHIQIQGDDHFVPARGVRSGNGTLDDPYVISGYYVTGDLYLGDTDSCFEVKENYIQGQLTLNWNGQCAWVHHNFIRDLRVNENVRRTGYATGGLIEANQIEFIGQLRHYDGELRHNVVGPRTADSAFDEVLEETPLLIPNLLLANIDGFNQGLIHHNTFHGPVDLDYHGHHHGTGFFAPHSHYHGQDEAHMPDHHEDHTDRWTSVAFTDNKVIDDVAYGLRYEDENHAGDDRTATSEDNDMLDEDHVHHTDITIARNVVEGGQIWVDVFNADDQRHHDVNPGWLNVMDNTVVLKERADRGLLGLGVYVPFFAFDPARPYIAHAAILVQAGKEVEATIAGNTLRWVPAEGERAADPLNLRPMFGDDQVLPSAIHIEGIRSANLLIANNRAEGFHYGVNAREFDEATNWTLSGNEFAGAKYEAYYDETVQNKPVER